MPALRGSDVLRRGSRRIHRRDVERAAHLRSAADGLDRTCRLALRQVDHVRGTYERQRFLATGRMHAVPVADGGEGLGLVEDIPVHDAVTERTGDDLGVFRETRRRIALRPTARLLQGLRQVPVIQRHERTNAGAERCVHESPVIVEALRIGGAATARLNPRPGDGESVALEIELCEKRDVLRIAVVAVAGNIAVIVVQNPAGCVRKSIPDRLTLAILLPGALHLIRSGGCAPDEARRKSVSGDGTLQRRRACAPACGNPAAGYAHDSLQEIASTHSDPYRPAEPRWWCGWCTSGFSKAGPRRSCLTPIVAAGRRLGRMRSRSAPCRPRQLANTWRYR